METAETSRWRKTEMFFGLTIKSSNGTTIRNITEHEFAAFLQQEVTPRFPNGTTVLNSTGSYFSHLQHHTVSERSRYLLVYHPDAAVYAERVEAIAHSYMKQFSQESVLYTSIPSTVCFSDCGCSEPVELVPQPQNQGWQEKDMASSCWGRFDVLLSRDNLACLAMLLSTLNLVLLCTCLALNKRAFCFSSLQQHLPASTKPCS